MASYTIREAAKATGLSESTIRSLVKKGKLAAEKEKGVYRISEEAVQSYIVAKGEKEKKLDIKEIIQPIQSDDKLYQEMKERIAFLEEELRKCQNLIERLTNRAFPEKRPPDNRGALQRMKDWIVGTKGSSST